MMFQHLPMMSLQINPVTRGVILLLLIGGWSLASVFFSSSSSDVAQESKSSSRRLLAVDEEGHEAAHDRDELEADGEAAPTSAPEEIVTRIELESPEGYNSWSRLEGWDLETRKIRIELRDGHLDHWNQGKWFGIRHIVVHGVEVNPPETLTTAEIPGKCKSQSTILISLF